MIPSESPEKRARRDALREETLRDIPWWYSPWGHLAATTGIGIAMLIVAALNLHNVRPLEWLVIPATWLVGNAFEWRVHKHVLHKRSWPFEVVFEKHTPMHHGIYIEHDMAIHDPREFRLVLIPAAGVLGIILFVAPLAYLFSLLFGANAGWLLLVTSGVNMVVYELSHLSYHLHESHFISRNPIIKVLRRHHAKHHDPHLMQKWNFNVTVPLFDWIMGTIAPHSETPAEPLPAEAPKKEPKPHPT